MKKLKLLRAKRGMSQRDLAKRAGLSRVTVARAEKEGVDEDARPMTLYKLARALDVEVEDLFEANSEVHVS